jgi:hypothetical protein
MSTRPKRSESLTSFEVAVDQSEPLRSRLRPQAGEHLLRCVHADDLVPPLGQRQRQAAGADPELEDRAALGEGVETLDGAVRVERRAVEGVVRVGHVAPVGARIVRAHAPQPSPA